MKKVTSINSDLIVITFIAYIFIISGCKQSSHPNKTDLNSAVLNEVIFDTLKFYAPHSKFGNDGTYKIVNNSIYKNQEVLSIGNIIDHSIHIFSFKSRQLLNIIPLAVDGPNTTISDYIFFHQILPNGNLLIIDGIQKRISIIDDLGNRLKTIKIGIDSIFDYNPYVEHSIKGLIQDSFFLYPILPWGSIFKNNMDPRSKSLKHLLKFNMNSNTYSYQISRTNYYNLDGLFNMDMCCLSSFLDNYKNNLFISNCADPFVKMYDISSNKIIDSIEMRSTQFDHVPPYNKYISEQEFKNLPAQSWRDLWEYGHTHPSYYELHIDTTHHLIIRQAKLGMNEEEHRQDRTAWAHSFIFSSLETHTPLGEAIVKRGRIKGPNFLNGFMTSEGLMFPFSDLKNGPDENYIYFVRSTFVHK